MHSLPKEFESTDAQKVSAHLIKALHESEGILSFADFMRGALYTPNVGYYMRERSPFSAQGDFITAPLLTPLFGRTLAAPIAAWFEALPDSATMVLELGAGTGALAASLLPALVEKLEGQGRLLQHYIILELSGARRAEQHATLKAALPPALFERVVWWDHLPETWSGILIANEVLDAVPVHRVRWSQNQYWELGVEMVDGEWSECIRPLNGSRSYDVELAARAQHYLPPIEGYTSEIHLEAEGLVRSLAQCITQGVMLWIDYGFDAATYYHPERSQGTIRVHQRHRSHNAWWKDAGEVDITAHVNFEAIAEVAAERGWACEGYVTQAAFLLGAGLVNLLPPIETTSTQDYARQAQPVHMLVSPAEMGELFKMVVLSRGLSNDLWVPGVVDVDAFPPIDQPVFGL